MLKKVNAVSRICNKARTGKYLFTEVRGKAVCLRCGERTALFTVCTGMKYAENTKTTLILQDQDIGRFAS